MPTPDLKLAARKWVSALSLSRCFVEVSPMVKKSCTVNLRTKDTLEISPLSLVERLSSSQRFVLQAKNAANKVTDVCVCANLWFWMPWFLKCIRTIKAMYLSSVVLLFHSLFYMENLSKPQNYQNWGVSACARMGTYPEQHSKYWEVNFFEGKEQLSC